MNLVGKLLQSRMANRHGATRFIIQKTMLCFFGNLLQIAFGALGALLHPAGRCRADNGGQLRPNVGTQIFSQATDPIR